MVDILKHLHTESSLKTRKHEYNIALTCKFTCGLHTRLFTESKCMHIETFYIQKKE